WESINGSAYTLVSSQTYTGTSLIFAVTGNAAAATKKYFFRLYPGGSVCGLPNNSDTTTTIIGQIPAPTINVVGLTMTVSNVDAGATYTWQMQDASNNWNDIVPTANGTSYTATAS